MKVLNRDFNGYINNGLIKRFVGFIDLAKYNEFLINMIHENKVKIIPSKLSIYWSEVPLATWFETYYYLFGFDDLVKERTKKYYRLKEKLGFNLFPDYLVLRDNEWLRVEVENWVHKYYYCHGEGYADIIVAYDDIKPSLDTSSEEKITYREHYGVDELIHLGEIPDYLYVTNKQFQSEYDRIKARDIARTMGIKELPQ